MLRVGRHRVICRTPRFIRHLPTSRTILSRNEASQDEEDPLVTNPYYEKYVDKIKEAKKSGLYKPKTEKMSGRLRKETEEWKAHIAKVEEAFNKRKQEHSEKAGCTLPTSLNELMRVELLEEKNAEEIANIWTEYHKNKDSVGAVIPANDYQNLLNLADSYPLFLYPLPKSQGYEFVLSQFTQPSNRCFFTSLINFQVHGDSAPWQLCLVYYTELMESKGIVLMSGEFDDKYLSVMEAQCLAQLQSIFYASPDEMRRNLIECFNDTPDKFKHMHLVKAIENSDMIVKMTK